MRAITPVFSVLLIVILSVALVGFLWLFFTGTINSLTSTGTSTVSESLVTISSCMKIESVYGNQVSLRNCGKGIIALNSLSAYLDDVPLNISLSGSSSLTFGYTTIGSKADRWAARDKGGDKFTISENGIVTSISLYIINYTPPTNVKVGIYKDDGTGGAPKTLIGQSYSEAITANNSWHTWSGLNILLTAGNYYIFLVTDNVLYNAMDDGTNGYWQTLTTYANEMISPCQTMNSQPFVDSFYATYTPMQGAGFFGKTDMTGTNNNPDYESHHDPNYKGVNRFLAPSDGVINQISLYVSAASGAPAVAKFVVYSDNGGYPNTLLGVSNEITIPGNNNFAWLSGSLNVNIQANKYYWIGVITSGNQIDRKYVWGTGTVYCWNGDAYSNGASDPFGSTSNCGDSTIFSIYATYTPASMSVINEDDTGTVSLSGLWNFNPGRHTLRIASPRVVTEVPVDAVLPDSCVMDLEFDEGQGTIAHDSSGNGNDGTLGNGTVGTQSSWKSGTACKYGNCLGFEGTPGVIADVVNVTDIPNTSLTIMAWIYPKQISGDERAIASKWANGDGTSEWLFRLDQSGKLEFHILNMSGGYEGPVSSSSSVAINSWSHVAAVYDRTNKQVSFYINGIYSGGGYFTGQTRDGSSIIRIGAQGDSGSTYDPFNGTIDSVRIYNQALAPDQTISLRPVSYD